jgi:[ribosomal protein S18]-alanine N-acetyltransferase
MKKQSKGEVHLRPYQSEDFEALHALDQTCFVPGIAYSKAMLRYFLNEPAAVCVVAETEDEEEIAGFILGETNRQLGHIVTLDVAQEYRRLGVGSLLLNALEKQFAAAGIRGMVIETAVNNDAAVEFWQRHGYRTEATLKRYYLSRVDAWQMRKPLSAPKKNGAAAGRR